MSAQQVPRTLQSGSQLQVPNPAVWTSKPQAPAQLPAARHTPRSARHVVPCLHTPQAPPQPSPPHARPLQSGLHGPQCAAKSPQQMPLATQSPLHEQGVPSGRVLAPPQLPAQPTLAAHAVPVVPGMGRQVCAWLHLPQLPPPWPAPQPRPWQSACSHLPALQNAPSPQLPHEPPQPSGPHARSLHAGAQRAQNVARSAQQPWGDFSQSTAHEQRVPSARRLTSPHLSLQPIAGAHSAQKSVQQGPPWLPVQSDRQLHEEVSFLPLSRGTSRIVPQRPAHELAAPQRWLARQSLPALHAPHVPPQPSGPHSRPSQLGAHLAQWVCLSEQQVPLFSQPGAHEQGAPFSVPKPPQRPLQPPAARQLPSLAHPLPTGQLMQASAWPAGTQRPAGNAHVRPCGHAPQLPPQPSGPHSAPAGQ